MWLGNNVRYSGLLIYTNINIKHWRGDFKSTSRMFFNLQDEQILLVRASDRILLICSYFIRSKQTSRKLEGENNRECFSVLVIWNLFKSLCKLSLVILKENSDQQFSANFEAGVVWHGSSYQDFVMPELGKIMSKKFQLSKDMKGWKN